MRRIAGVVAGSVLILVVCGGCGVSPSESLVGMWKTDRNGVYVEFRDDGTYQATADSGDTILLESGSWSIDGGVLTQTPASDSLHCSGIIATYEVKVVDDGNRLEPNVRDDTCQERLDDFESGLTRVRQR